MIMIVAAVQVVQCVSPNQISLFANAMQIMKLSMKLVNSFDTTTKHDVSLV